MRLSTIIAAVAFCLSASGALAGAGPAGHSHEGFSAGEPGDPKKPSRIVTVSMRDDDGKMSFVPDKVEVRAGEQIKFVIQNKGVLDHEFVLASTAENLKHAEAMKKNPDMEHDDPNAKRVAPEKKEEIVWRFTKKGTFEYGCLIPGHRESGMVGTVVVN
jgi:uncharacterized cupredoxin-like copper-binding protein